MPDLIPEYNHSYIVPREYTRFVLAVNNFMHAYEQAGFVGVTQGEVFSASVGMRIAHHEWVAKDREGAMSLENYTFMPKPALQQLLSHISEFMPVNKKE